MTYSDLYDIYFNNDIDAMESLGIYDIYLLSDTDILYVEYNDESIEYWHSDDTVDFEMPGTEWALDG